MQKKDRSVFTQTLALNFVIVAVIVICIMFASAGLRKTMQIKEEENCRIMLSEGMDHLNANLQAIRDDIMMFRDSVAKVNMKGLLRYDAVNLLETKSKLISIVNNNELVCDVALVYEDRDMVITSSSIYYSIDDFLYIYSFEGMDVGRFYSYLDSEYTLATMRFLPCSSIDHWDRSKIETAFCYAIPLDTERFSTRKGVAYVFIKEENLVDSFISEQIRPYASFYLHNHRAADSQPLFMSRGNGESDSGHFDATLINSMETLRAEIRISQSYIDLQMAATQRYLTSILAAAVLSGIGTAMWAAYRQSLPMKQALRRLRDRGMLGSRKKNEYSALMSSVEKLLKENETIHRELSGYQASLHQNLLDRLFSNNLMSYDAEEALRMELGNFPEKALVYCGRIFIPSADTNLSMEMTLVMVLEFLKKHLPSSAVLHSTDTLTFGLIFPCTGPVGEAERPLKWVLAEIPKKFSAKVVLTLGGVCESMHQIGLCFERAQGAYIEEERGGLSDCLIIHPGDLGDREQGLRLRMLQEMYQFMIAGEAENAVSAMRRFYGCPADMLLINHRERYHVLRAYIMMAAREIAPDKEAVDITAQNSCKTFEDQTAALAEGIRQVCEYVNERQNSVQGDQCTVYTDYLKEHFADPELCASSLANEFRVSEKYLFGLFKKKTGYSPTSYLHHIRMEEAVRLLLECSDTVQEISVRVGFVNFGTFYKAFKREYGVAPGRYRELHRT